MVDKDLKNLFVALRHYVVVTAVIDDHIVEQAYNDVLYEINILIKKPEREQEREHEDL